MFDFFRKPKLKDGITEREFACKRDGLTIRGSEYRPDGEKLPIAIVCHGFMAWQDTVRHYAVMLAEMGYAAYCFDFNGGSVMRSKSDGRNIEMSVLTEIKDLEAVIAHVKSLPYVNPDELLLMGCSQGGFVSALTAAKLKGLVRKLVLFYPAFCIPDDARAGKMMMSKFDPQNLPETVKCGPMKLGRCYMADVMDMNPFEEVKAYEGDVLIVHGTADKIVNIKYAEQAFDTYKNEPYERKVEYYAIKGGTHMFSKKHDVLAMNYLKQYLEFK